MARSNIALLAGINIKRSVGSANQYLLVDKHAHGLACRHMTDTGFLGDFSLARDRTKHVIALAYSPLDNRHNVFEFLPPGHSSIPLVNNQPIYLSSAISYSLKCYSLRKIVDRASLVDIVHQCYSCENVLARGTDEHLAFATWNCGYPGGGSPRRCCRRGARGGGAMGNLRGGGSDHQWHGGWSRLYRPYRRARGQRSAMRVPRRSRPVHGIHRQSGCPGAGCPLLHSRFTRWQWNKRDTQPLYQRQIPNQFADDLEICLSIWRLSI